MSFYRSKRRFRFVGVIIVAVVGSCGTYFLSRPHPLYGQLRFGPEGNLRVWLVLRGDTLYLDSSGGPTPRRAHHLGKSPVAKPIELRDPDQLTVYRITGISMVYVPRVGGPHRPQELAVDVDISGPVKYSQYTTVPLTAVLQQAQTAYFHDPLTVQADESEAAQPWIFVPGQTKDIRVIVGTFRPECGCWVAVYSNDPRDRKVRAFPPEVVPVVDIQFPPKDSHAPPVHRRVALRGFC